MLAANAWQGRHVQARGSNRLTGKEGTKKFVPGLLGCYRARRPFFARASGGPKGRDGEDDSPAVKELEEKIRQRGIDASAAKRILKIWKEAGAEDAKQLRQLFIRGSIAPITTVLFQALLDAGIAYGGITASTVISQGPDFPGRVAVEWLLVFLAMYCAVGVLFDLFTAGALVVSAARFGTNSSAFLKAIQGIAGGRLDTRVDVLSKAQQAVNSAKVVAALLSMAQLLQSESGLPGKDEDASTLTNLSVYFLLLRAEELYGFRPEDYGLDSEEAGNIARVFAQYDSNGDLKLEHRELGKLCSELGKELTENELREAIKILDQDDSGYLEFDEFVGWWTGKVMVNTR